MKTRIVHTKFWEDDFIESLTITQKLLFIYYITNSEVNLIHLYECSEKRTSFETGISTTDIQKAKEVFEANGKIFFYKSYVYLKNADRYEDYSKEKHIKAKERILSQLSSNVLEWYTGKRDQYDTGIIPDIIHKPEIINHKSENINHKPEERKEKEKKEEKTDTTTLSEEEKYVFECFIALGYKDNGTFKAFMVEIVKDLPRVDLRQNAKAWKFHFEEKGVKNHKTSFLNWASKPYAVQKPVSNEPFYQKFSDATEKNPTPEEVTSTRKKAADAWRKAAEKNPFLRNSKETREMLAAKFTLKTNT